MTVNYATGEITDDLTRNEAERLSIRISARLDTMADNYVAVMPMIREALTRQAHVALGYRSPGDYARERFGDALSKLDPAMRREVVQELTEAGMSTRAIAPVVGASFNTVARDARVSPDTPQTPESVHGGEAVTDSGQTPEPSSRGSEAGAPAPEVQPERVEPPAPRPAVTGIDGKTYTRPTPSPKPEVVAQSDQDRAVELIDTVARNLTVLSQVVHQQRRTAICEAFPLVIDHVSPTQTERFTPEQMRAVADGLHDLADEWNDQ